jgi:hypothetical protein
MKSGSGEKEMKRYVMVALLALVAIAPLAAQTPQGWKQRVDRSIGRYQVRHQWSGLPCDESAGGGVLESGEHGDGQLHA